MKPPLPLFCQIAAFTIQIRDAGTQLMPCKFAGNINVMDTCGISRSRELCIQTGTVRLLIGDLTNRTGTYALVMYERYSTFEEQNIRNPFLTLAGEFPSFGELEKTINGAPGLELIGSSEFGFVPGIETSKGRYARVGEIVYPLLQPDEIITLTNLDHRIAKLNKV